VEAQEPDKQNMRAQLAGRHTGAEGDRHLGLARCSNPRFGEVQQVQDTPHFYLSMRMALPSFSA
jgi:hypothetical protein